MVKCTGKMVYADYTDKAAHNACNKYIDAAAGGEATKVSICGKGENKK